MNKTSTSTGPAFTWIADNEATYRSSPTYPIAVRRYMSGVGSGTLALTPASPLSSLGLPLLGGQPSLTSLTVPLDPAAATHDLLGFPRLELSYQGFATPARTWVYAQLIDDTSHRVVNSQVTPIPLTLDRTVRTVSLQLNAISSHSPRGARYHLELLPGSLIFGLQRSVGVVTMRHIAVGLPWIS